jgi:hypothetical protein
MQTVSPIVSSATATATAPTAAPAPTATAPKQKGNRQGIADAGKAIASIMASETARKVLRTAIDSVKRADLVSDKGDTSARSVERIESADLAALAAQLVRAASALKVLCKATAADRKGANIRTRIGSISAEAYLQRLADAVGKGDAMADLASE